MAIAPKICRYAGVSTAQILPVGAPSDTMSADCPENANTASGIPASVPSGASCAFGHIAKERFHKNAKTASDTETVFSMCNAETVFLPYRQD